MNKDRIQQLNEAINKESLTGNLKKDIAISIQQILKNGHVNHNLYNMLHKNTDSMQDKYLIQFLSLVGVNTKGQDERYISQLLDGIRKAYKQKVKDMKRKDNDRFGKYSRKGRGDRV